MTLKQRIFLISAICIIFGGLLVSYKSFELNNKYKIQSENEKGIEVAQWVAQTIEQKVTHLESSVSYLDASTIETLKRMGARYFAYAYQKEGQWRIKSKVLDALDRKGIIKEVNEVSFKEMPANRRVWHLNDAGEHILISPVELANSHQLKNGFLVFGLNESFFSFVGSGDKEISLISANQKTLYSQSKTSLTSFVEQMRSTTDAIRYDEAGESRALSSFFSKPTQMWVARSQVMKASSYLSSSMFSYFLLALVLSLGFMALLLQRLLSSTEADMTKERSSNSSLLDGVRAAGDSMSRLGGAMRSKMGRSSSGEEGRPTVEKDLGEEAISDFSGFLEDVISLERSRMKKFNVSVKTQVEENASVMCSPQHITDFMRRLIENSIQALKAEDDKTVQIELVRAGDDYQLIYVDTRRSQYPSGEEPSLFLQDESSLENINGLISYGTWLFGEKLTVAKKGFCLSIDLKRSDEKTINPDVAVVEALNASADEERIEIREEDTIDLQFEKVTSLPDLEEAKPVEEDFSSQSIDDIVNSFEMKNFSFDSVSDVAQEEIVENDAEKQIEDNGFFEFDTGDFKIKIRSPKTKGDTDVSR